MEILDQMFVAFPMLLYTVVGTLPAYELISSLEGLKRQGRRGVGFEGSVRPPGRRVVAGPAS